MSILNFCALPSTPLSHSSPALSLPIPILLTPFYFYFHFIDSFSLPSSPSLALPLLPSSSIPSSSSLPPFPFLSSSLSPYLPTHHLPLRNFCSVQLWIIIICIYCIDKM